MSRGWMSFVISWWRWGCISAETKYDTTMCYYKQGLLFLYWQAVNTVVDNVFSLIHLTHVCQWQLQAFYWCRLPCFTTLDLTWMNIAVLDRPSSCYPKYLRTFFVDIFIFGSIFYLFWRQGVTSTFSSLVFLLWLSFEFEFKRHTLSAPNSMNRFFSC